LAGAGIVALALLLAWIGQRRRRAADELDLLTSWDAFKAPSPSAEPEQKAVPSLEGNVMDGTVEVQAMLDLDDLM